MLSQNTKSPIVLYATSRKGEDLGLPDSKPHRTIYHPLDISKPDSIASLVKTIKSNNDTPVSVLINNGGVNLDDKFNAENAKTTLDVNYRGTLNMCQTFIPLMAKNGRIVNVSSTGSSLSPYSKENAQRFRSISSLEELEQFMKEYESAVSQGKDAAAGFPDHRAYGVSKAAMNSFTATLAKMNPDLAINCCCPGWVDTGMGNMLGQPPKTPQEGAKIPVRLGFGDIGGVSGKYWGNDSVNGRGEGKVQPW